MFELYNSGPAPIAARPTSPQLRHEILERQIKTMTACGYYLLIEFDDRAVLARERSISLVEIFVDEYGELWYP
jgi:hypothetical protein